jgi:UDP-3-O-[3-hydroxymyristoyl] N-acetylglucosamine deacetylase
MHQEPHASVKRTIAGFGLHTGAACRVVLEPVEGPLRMRSGGVVATVEELCVVDHRRSTTVATRDGDLRIATIEHFFAALAALGIRTGVSAAVDGPEMPLLDGGAAAWCEALQTLDLPRSEPLSRVVRHGVVEVDASRYEWSPDDRVSVEVSIEFGDSRMASQASWFGDASDFTRRIAPARTFAIARDLSELAQGGFARGVTPEAVLLFTPDTVHCAGRPFSPDEPARHKLLDLIGDLYLFGGPPRGHLHAHRPGHRANALATEQALAEGILVRIPTVPGRPRDERTGSLGGKEGEEIS